ncbi:sugar phosphate isomerase/epimerase family protein [Spirochaeta isovalerica]|uniref:Sugar phosphate isomerase/epimerase n=1 Tax=Spirochaeta isovalerica TaxID=150 RepID=A0A841RHJ3_9SPIO|nr:TIM barrel protein [Spirochaeta isovalerica]MBB6482480.1 sugar phosphate isomerase/epimerase [Spirochaeta isovalerica]
MDSLYDNVRLCNELNLDLLEINMNLPQFQLKEMEDLKIGSLEYSIHLPEDLNIWAFNENVLDAHIKTVIDTIRFCKLKKIKKINMHMNPGIYFTLPQKKVFLFEKYYDTYIQNTINFGKIVECELSGTEIEVFVENTGIYHLWFIRKAVEELLKINCFKLTWDVGHEFSSGTNDSEFLAANKKYINHLHLHDAIGSNNHLPLGTGQINIDRIMDMAGQYIKSIIFETKTVDGLIESVEFYRKHIHDTI